MSSKLAVNAPAKPDLVKLGLAISTRNGRIVKRVNLRERSHFHPMLSWLLAMKCRLRRLI